MDHDHGPDDVRLDDHPVAVLAAQPAGAWTGEAYRRVVAAIRAALAEEGLTQAHWWTLNHVAGAPGRWARGELTSRLLTWDDLDTDFDGVYDDLAARGLLEEEGGTMTLTRAGLDARQRARERLAPVLARTKRGIDAHDYATAIDVLRRIVANLGGDGNLPG